MEKTIVRKESRMNVKAIILAAALMCLLLGTAMAATLGETMALQEASTLLASMPLSSSGLLDRLRLGGYTEEEAEYAMRQCQADWTQQAIRAIKGYQHVSQMSLDAIAHQLSDDGFTKDQIAEAMKHLEEPGKGEAERLARQYRNLAEYSPEELVDQLKKEGIEEEEARKAVDKVLGEAPTGADQGGHEPQPAEGSHEPPHEADATREGPEHEKAGDHGN